MTTEMRGSMFMWKLLVRFMLLMVRQHLVSGEAVTLEMDLAMLLKSMDSE